MNRSFNRQGFKRMHVESLSDEALVQLLFTEEDRLSRAAVDELCARGARMIASLTAIVTDPERWGAELPAWWAPIHATFILGAIGGSDAIPGLLAAAEQAEEEDCDWVREVWPSICGRIGREMQEPLRRLFGDPARSPGLRALAAQGLAATTLAASDGAVAIFGELTAALGRENDRLFKELVGNTLLDFKIKAARDVLLADAREQVARMDREGWLFVAFTPEDVEEALGSGVPSLRHYTRDWLDFYSPTSIARRQGRWAEEDARRQDNDEDIDVEVDEEERDEPLVPVVRAVLKMGRNDPCSCGSGKKYKKCCLGKLDQNQETVGVSHHENSEQGDGMEVGVSEPRTDKMYILDVFLIGGPITEQFAKENPVVSRTIEIRGAQTLQALHDEIFHAFDRWEEHMYEFQIGGKGPMDRRAKTYVLPSAMNPPMSWSPKPAGDLTRTTIESLGLKADDAFGYWFDFGDGWHHQINVVGIEQKAPGGHYPKVTKRVGESPPQYADWDED